MLHVYATLQYMYSIYIPLHLYDYEAEGKLSIYMLGQWIILLFSFFTGFIYFWTSQYFKNWSFHIKYMENM